MNIRIFEQMHSDCF